MSNNLEVCIAEEDISGVKNGISLSEAQLPHVRKIQQFQCTHPTHPTLLPPSMLRRADRSCAQSSGTHQQAASCPLIFCFTQAALATRKRGRAQTRSSFDRRLHRFCNSSSPTAIINNLAVLSYPAKKHADFSTEVAKDSDQQRESFQRRFRALIAAGSLGRAAKQGWETICIFCIICLAFG